MRSQSFKVLLLGAALLAPSFPALADEATDAFNSLYGDDLKRVLATPDKTDDVLLAGKLVAAAKAVSVPPALTTLLCEKAYDLGKTPPTGHAIAIEAMELLGGKVPEKRVACQEKILVIRQAEYDASRSDDRTKTGEPLLDALTALCDAKAEAGDATAASDLARRALAIATALKSDSKAAIQARLDQFAARQKVEKQGQALKAQVDANPADAAARNQLIKFCIVELDNPSEAAKYVNDSADAVLKKYVPAAAKGADETPELAAKELGDWYRGMADQAAAATKPAMLQRAKAYYDRFLSLHSAEDVTRAQVVLAAKKIEEAMAPSATGPDATTPAKTAAKGAAGKGAGASDTLQAAQWYDILKLVDTQKDFLSGSLLTGWSRQGAAIVSSGSYHTGYSRIPVPVAPSGDYELQVKFAMSFSTYGEVGIHLPVGANSVMLMVNSGGPSGLSYISDSSSYYSGVGPTPVLAVNKVYTVDAKVAIKGDEATIAANLDGKPLVRWQGPQSNLRSSYFMDRRYFGLLSYYGTATFGTMRLRMTSGEAKVLKPGEKPSSLAPTGTRAGTVTPAERPAPGAASKTATPGKTATQGVSPSPSKSPTP